MRPRMMCCVVSVIRPCLMLVKSEGGGRERGSLTPKLLATGTRVAPCEVLCPLPMPWPICSPIGPDKQRGPVLGFTLNDFFTPVSGPFEAATPVSDLVCNVLEAVFSNIKF